MFSILLAASCAVSFALDFDQGIDVRQALESAREAAPAPAVRPKGVPSAEKAEWTVMYFINGKNNLESYVDPDMNHMEDVGSTDKLKIVVEVGKLETSAKRYLMQKDETPGSVTSPVVQDLGKVDMGDWKHLAEYGKWVKANYPAKRYMLSIWNHGSGWKGEDKGISYDDETGNHISTQDLAKALAEMGGVDLYASDACLMQMAEVGYELRNQAGVIVGSEENEPAQGWNYAYYLGPLAENPGMSPEGVSQAYVEAFRRSYAAAGLDTTASSIASDSFRQLVPLLNAWTQAVMAADEKTVVKEARVGVQTFSNWNHVDLVHFVTLVNGKTGNGGVKTAGDALLKFLREKMILANTTTGNSHANASGLAVYLPTSYVDSAYADLAWARESGWPAFVQWVVGVHSAEGTTARR